MPVTPACLNAGGSSLTTILITPILTAMRMKTYFTTILTAIAGIILISCDIQGDNSDQGDEPVEREITIGRGSFQFDQYAPLKDKPLNVWYYNPADDHEELAGLPVMILMHGNSRAAESYRNAMSQYAYEYNFLLIVPEFSREYYPSSRDYHQGGVFSENGTPMPEEKWAFSLIEPLFDHVKQITENRSETYIMYGFSAGSQFVHRFLMHKPENRTSTVVAASAGTYSMPDYDTEYAYGLKNTTVSTEALERFFGQDVTIMVGDADTVRARSDLVKTLEADQQGRDRVERGREFFNRSQRMADSLGVRLNWDFKLASGVGHSQSEIAEDAAKIIFDHEHIKKVVQLQKNGRIREVSTLAEEDAWQAEFTLWRSI